MSVRCGLGLGLILTILGWGLPAAAANPDRPFAEEVIYFVVTDRFDNGDPGNDRGGLTGDAGVTGFDPADIGMFQGGDFRGLTRRLDYIQGLGATAIWVTPPVVNKVVQRYAGGRSAGYHGYWGLDFLNVDPHLGGNDDFRTFVEAAHARGLKVFMDIVVNHTADIIQYRECSADPVSAPCPYRSKGDYPTPHGAVDGAYAYTPVVPAGQEGAKNPAWLNDPRHYHNRGESSFKGESSLFGDFARLDDLYTEQPAVLDGWIEIYKHWIRDYRIDGFRLDTARHVNADFWPRFVAETTAYAREQGIPNFFIFGEVADRAITELAAFAHLSGLPSVLDFGFFQAAIDTLAEGRPLVAWERLYNADRLYPGGPGSAANLTTFISNHDNGRLAWLIRQANPRMPAVEIQARVILGHALMFLGRGVPVIYYGDEQGFMGLGDDKQARQPMFVTPARQFNREERLGPAVPRGADSFRPDHPLYRALAELAAIRRDHPGLRGGELRVRFMAEEGAGLFVFSRIDPVRGEEYLVAVNTATSAWSVRVEADGPGEAWTAVRGACAPGVAGTQSYGVTVPALDYVVCRKG